MFETPVNLEKMSAHKDIMDKWRRNKHGDPRRKVRNLAKSVGEMFYFFSLLNGDLILKQHPLKKGPGGPAGRKEGSHENQFRELLILPFFCSKRN